MVNGSLKMQTVPVNNYFMYVATNGHLSELDSLHDSNDEDARRWFRDEATDYLHKQVHDKVSYVTDDIDD